ncbi:ABC transporter permease [Patescibacteria group bacterium AH-259-L07]|nr:ABC transporter permease [Patescibacteria group bacterium AH-259-L07]
MRTVFRAIRNIYRSPTRTILIIAVLGLAIGISITMQQTATIVSATSKALKENIQTLIEVRAEGATGMGRGVQPLAEDTVEKIEDIPNIIGLEKYLYVRRVDNTKKYTVSVISGLYPITSELRVNSHGEVGAPTIVKGRAFREDDEGNNAAIAGTIFAQENNLDVGSSFELDGETLDIIGIFDSGFVFGDNQIFIPLDTAQKFAVSQEYIPDETRISQIFVVVNSVDNVPLVEKTLREQLDDVDVLSGQKNVFLASEALSTIQRESFYGSYFTVLISALIIIFTMVLIGRERTKEIGILKAIGASNGEVAKQFIVETSAIAILGSIFGIILFAFFAPFLANSLLGLSTTSLTGLSGGMGAQAADDILSFSISAKVILSGVLLGILLAIIGSIYPVYRAVKLKPAEALRYE